MYLRVKPWSRILYFLNESRHILKEQVMEVLLLHILQLEGWPVLSSNHFDGEIPRGGSLQGLACRCHYVVCQVGFSIKGCSSSQFQIFNSIYTNTIKWRHGNKSIKCEILVSNLERKSFQDQHGSWLSISENCQKKKERIIEFRKGFVRYPINNM